MPVLDPTQITNCSQFKSDLHFCSRMPVLAGVETLSEHEASDVSLLTLSCGMLGPLSLLAPAQCLAASDASAHKCPTILLASLAQQCSLRPCPDLVSSASLLPLPVPAMTPPMMSVAVKDVTTMLDRLRAAAQPVDVLCSPLPPSLHALPAQQELWLFETLCKPASLAAQSVSSVCVLLHVLDGCVQIRLQVEQHSPGYAGGRSGLVAVLPVASKQYMHLLRNLYHALEVCFQATVAAPASFDRAHAVMQIRHARLGCTEPVTRAGTYAPLVSMLTALTSLTVSTAPALQLSAPSMPLQPLPCASMALLSGQTLPRFPSEDSYLRALLCGNMAAGPFSDHTTLAARERADRQSHGRQTIESSQQGQQSALQFEGLLPLLLSNDRNNLLPLPRPPALADLVPARTTDALPASWHIDAAAAHAWHAARPAGCGPCFTEQLHCGA